MAPPRHRSLAPTSGRRAPARPLGLDARRGVSGPGGAVVFRRALGVADRAGAERYLTELQRSAGNRAVQSLFGDTSQSLGVQRQCATGCDCCGNSGANLDSTVLSSVGVQRNGGGALAGPPAPPTRVECERDAAGHFVTPGTFLEKTNRAVAAGNYEDAFCVLNGLWMVDMLVTLEGAGRPTGIDLWNHLGVAVGKFGVPRLRVAIAAVLDHDPCGLEIPNDLPPDQEREIKEFQARAGRAAPIAYRWRIAEIGRLLESTRPFGQIVTDIHTLVAGLPAARQALAVQDLEGARLAYEAAGRTTCAETLNKVRRQLYAAAATAQFPGHTAPATEQPPSSAPAELLAGTHALSPADQARLRTALVPPRQLVPGGRLPDFHSTIPASPQPFEVRLRERTRTMIDELHAVHGAPRGAVDHADPAKTDPMTRFVEIANAAKTESDKVYGSYRVGPAFVAGTNLHDWWQEAQADLSAMTPAQVETKMQWWLDHLLVSDDAVRDLMRAHGAIPGRTTVSPGERESEQAVIERVRNSFTSDAAQRQRLSEIYRGWDGMQSTGHVYLQTFRPAGDHAQRHHAWDMFQVAIHEYMHSLQHSAYGTYAQSFGGAETEQYNTLIEGVACLLAETAWSTIAARAGDPSLRALVEGPTLAAQPFEANAVPDPGGRRYPSFDQALRVANVVGVRNLYAAFFLGRVEFVRASRPGGP